MKAMHHTHPESSIEYRVVYAVVFSSCLILASLFRLLPRRMHPWIEDSDACGRSLWLEARRAADSTVPYIFQGG